MRPEHKCIYCALYQQNGNKCPIFAQDVSMERGCPMFTNRLNPCDICKKHIGDVVNVYVEDDIVHCVCGQCDSAISNQPCQVCESIRYCAFQQDQSCQLPPFITVQQRQGNAIMQMQQKNPDRIKETCIKGCSCYNQELDECMRECGGCANLKIAWQK